MLLFIDIETVPLYQSLNEFPDAMRKHWEKKTKYLKLTTEQLEDNEVAYFQNAGIYAEWSKIICIGIGYIDGKTNELRITTVTNDDEKELLLEFKSLLKQFSSKSQVWFCGHNIKEFDLPFICRRMTIHSIPLPLSLNLAGLKPWENQHIDTMQLWRFGEYKRYTSLDLLALILGIDSPKQDIDGSQVAHVYYYEKDVERIRQYCMQDVETSAKVYYKLKQLPNPIKQVIKI